MKKVIIVIMLMISCTAQAGNYTGVQVASLKHESGVNLNVALVNFGTSVSENTYIEFRLGVGLGGDHSNLLNEKISIGSMYGAYVKGVLPLTDKIGAYAIAGMTEIEVCVDCRNNKYGHTDFDLGFRSSYGAGINYGDWYFEYMQYGNNFSSLSASVKLLY